MKLLPSRPRSRISVTVSSKVWITPPSSRNANSSSCSLTVSLSPMMLSKFATCFRPPQGRSTSVFVICVQTIERTFSWFGNYRRLSKDYEYLVYNADAMIYAAMVHLMTRRLARSETTASLFKWLLNINRSYTSVHSTKGEKSKWLLWSQQESRLREIRLHCRVIAHTWQTS